MILKQLFTIQNKALTIWRISNEQYYLFWLWHRFAYLLKVLKSKKNKDFKCGDEDVCSNCKFHSVVIDSISEVETNGND